MRIPVQAEHPLFAGGAGGLPRQQASPAPDQSAQGPASMSDIVTLTKAPVPHGADRVTARTTPLPPVDALQQIRQRLTDEYPDLRREARQDLQARLSSAYGVEVDADHTYFNTFAGASSSPTAYNGWGHQGRPLASVSLTDMQLQNFPANYGEDPNGLNANSGVYRQAVSASGFGVNNEVRLLSSDLKKAIRDTDFPAAYRARLDAYWDRNESAWALHYEALALEHSRGGGLSQEGRALLAQAAGHAGPDGAGSKAFRFDIDGYASRDMAWLQATDGRVVLFTPHGSTPLREYDDVDDMRHGIASMARTAAGRDELLRGFSLYNRQDGVVCQGVEKWLADIAGGGFDDRIARRPHRIDGDLFADLAHATRLASLDDVSRQVRANDDIARQETLQALGAFNGILGCTVTQMAQAGYALYVAGTASMPQDRRDAVSQAWSAGLNAAAFALLEGAGRGLVMRDHVVPVASFKAPARLADGRVGYPLSPIGPPRLPAPEPQSGGAAASDGASARGPYREPPLARSKPNADLPPRVGPGPGTEQPLDLSMPRTAAPAVPPLAASSDRLAVAPHRPVATVAPIQVARINHLGFRERSDFPELYGFQPYFGGDGDTVGGIRVGWRSPGIGAMVEGDMLRTYATFDEARLAACRTAHSRFDIYRIRADGLRAASFSDNNANNPAFQRLRLELTPPVVFRETAQHRLDRQAAILRASGDEIHFPVDQLTADRATVLYRNGVGFFNPRPFREDGTPV